MIDDKERCERVMTSDPINITAVRVMFKGEAYDYTHRDIIKLHQSECPLLAKIPCDMWKQPQWKDFTGFKKPKFKVIGLYAGRIASCLVNGDFYSVKTKRTNWVIQCQCGMYEIRTTKSLKRTDNLDDCCARCNAQDPKRIRDRDFKNRNGYYPHEEGLTSASQAEK